IALGERYSFLKTRIVSQADEVFIDAHLLRLTESRLHRTSQPFEGLLFVISPGVSASEVIHGHRVLIDLNCAMVGFGGFLVFAQRMQRMTETEPRRTVVWFAFGDRLIGFGGVHPILILEVGKRFLC